MPWCIWETGCVSSINLAHVSFFQTSLNLNQVRFVPVHSIESRLHGEREIGTREILELVRVRLSREKAKRNTITGFK